MSECGKDHGRYRCECDYLSRCPNCHAVYSGNDSCDCKIARNYAPIRRTS
jgi:hypothetical protein